MQTQFEGIWVPIITPFCGDDVDHPALARLAQYLASNGIAGLVAGATTGEGALLHPSEQEAIYATLRAAVPGLPVVLGLSHSSTRVAAEMARNMAAWQPDGLLVTAPPYVRPSQQGIRRHFEVIAEAADLPIMIYNIPYRTSVNIELETLQQLATDPRIVSIKECGGTLERMSRLVQETPLRVLAGEDSQNFSALCLGAHGTVAASAHILPHWHVRIRQLLQRGELEQARRLSVALQPIIRNLFAEPNPAPLKFLLAQLGWCENTLRLPFLPASRELGERLWADWQALQLLDQ